MKQIRLLLLLLSACWCLHGQSVNMEELQKQLHLLGMTTRGVRWQLVEATECVTVYQSTTGNKFFIAANDSYAPLLGNRILAYSNEAGFQGTESAWKQQLLKSYDSQLKSCRHQKGNNKHVARSKRRLDGGWHLSTGNRKARRIEPLTTTQWGQDWPYNEQCPIAVFPSTHRLTGCVATAMTQLMYYHRHPLQGAGTYRGGDGNGEYTVDFADIRPQWQMMQTRYPAMKNSNMDIRSIAELMAANARAVSSRFGLSSTSADALAARTIFVNHWNYSPQCKFIQSDDAKMLLSMIRDNLNRSLPVLISGGSHAFVCDGYSDDYYHFNLGWRGAANGYYKVVIAEELEANETIVKEIVCDLSPDSNVQTKAKSVHLAKAGTLERMLTKDERKSIRNLRISGRLNGKDIALLRRMMGATDGWKREAIYNTDGKWTGELQSLDISQASFVDDEYEVFLRIKTTEGRYTWRGRTYDIGNGNGKEYERFLNTDVSHGDGYRYVAYNGQPCLEFTVLPNRIAPMMFFDCHNLRTLKLPVGTRSILGCAFQRCTAMQNIVLQESVRQIEAGAFRECYLLREVECTRVPIETCHNLFPFKTEGRYGEYDNLLHRGLLEGINKYTCKGLVRNGRKISHLKYKKVY